MVEKRQTAEKEYNTRWQLYAVLSAVFAALTSVLAKIGITGVESNLGTAIRTIVVLVMSWLIVFIEGKQIQLKQIISSLFTIKRNHFHIPFRTCNRSFLAVLLLCHSKWYCKPCGTC